MSAPAGSGQRPRERTSHAPRRCNRARGQRGPTPRHTRSDDEERTVDRLRATKQDRTEEHTTTQPAAPATSVEHAHLLALQGAAGNQAVCRLLADASETP